VLIKHVSIKLQRFRVKVVYWCNIQLHLDRTELSADSAQNCLLWRGKLPDFRSSLLSVILSFNYDSLQKAERGALAVEIWGANWSWNWDYVRFTIQNAHGQLLINRAVHSYTVVITKNDSSRYDFHAGIAVLRFEPRLPATRSLGQLERTRGERKIFVHNVSISTVLTTEGRANWQVATGWRFCFSCSDLFC